MYVSASTTHKNFSWLFPHRPLWAVELFEFGSERATYVVVYSPIVQGSKFNTKPSRAGSTEANAVCIMPAFSMVAHSKEVPFEKAVLTNTYCHNPPRG